MADQVGEYGLPRYIKHPPPGASDPLSNGQPLDAGTAVIIDSNVSWLCQESPRHLVACNGPGAVPKVYSSNADVYTGIAGFGAPPSSTTFAAVTWQEIPWDRRCAMRFGPFPLIVDELSADGMGLARKVHVAVSLTNTGSTLTMYYVLALSPSPEDIYNSGTGASIPGIAYQRNATVTTGLDTASLVPSTRISIGAASYWLCRHNPTTTSGLSTVIPAWLFVGTRPVGGALSIDGVSAWEYR